MTSQEASWVAKQTAIGKKVKILYNKIPCTNVTISHLRAVKISNRDFDKNFYSGIYVWYDGSGTCNYSMCVKDENSDAIYKCNIKDLELVLNEK